MAVQADPRTVNGVAYQVQSYRPRIEGLFARIDGGHKTQPAPATGVRSPGQHYHPLRQR